MTSAGPPGANPTTMVTGRVGKAGASWAMAGAAAASAIATRPRRIIPGIASFPRVSASFMTRAKLGKEEFATAASRDR